MTTLNKIKQEYENKLQEELNILQDEFETAVGIINEYAPEEKKEEYMTEIEIEFNEERDFIIERYRKLQGRVKLYK